MKLTDIKKNADAKIAEEKAKREESRRLRELDIHPLVKWKCDRNVREAYFQGVVFAALTNDLKIDEAEQKILLRIGNSLAIPKDEQVELTTLVQKSVDAAVNAGGEGVFIPLEGCVKTLKGENVFKLFVAEYVKVCGARELDVESVREQLADHIMPKLKVGLNTAFVSLLYRVVANGKDVLDVDLIALADYMDDDKTRYFLLDVFGDVEERLMAARKRAKAELKKKQEAMRLARVRQDFEDVIEEISEQYKTAGSMPSGWKSDIEKRLARFTKGDIDWVETIQRRLTQLSRIPHCYAKLVIYGQERMRRKIIWKLVGSLWVAEKTIYPEAVNDLLRTATQLSTEGYNDKVYAFIKRAFPGLVAVK